VSLRRALLLLVGTIVTVSTGLLPEFAGATINTSDFRQQTATPAAGSQFSAVPESDRGASADLAWANHSLEEARGFTEAAVAYEPEATQNGDDTQRAAAQKNSPLNARVPEPAALILFGTALIGIAHAARKKRKS
jgi:PEP-CTERM motif-containing protein